MARVHEKTEFSVSVIGCGRMGCAIAGEFVRRGCTVFLYDHTEYTRNRAFQTLRASLYDHVASGYLLKSDVEELIGRITLAHSLQEALEKSQVVIESVYEDLQLKKDLFNQMGEILKQRSVPADQMLLCSNTMNLSLADMTEDVCKEYRGCCIGMRFLHPVWFIDEVELADCDYTRRTTVNGAEKLLKQLFFQPFFYDNCYRRKLTLQEISTYQSRQMLRCPEPLKSLVPRRGFRRKNSLGAGSNSPGCCSPDQSSASSPVGSPSGPVGSAGEHVPVGSSSSSPHPESLLGEGGEGGEEHEDKEEPCAVCLDEPRSALLVPCGHMAMCTECSMRVLRGPRPICVVCRQPIEKVLRATLPP